MMDIERAKAIDSSTDWGEIKKELDLWIFGQMERTKVCDPDDLRKIQARIAAYEEVKNLPQIVIERNE